MHRSLAFRSSIFALAALLLGAAQLPAAEEAKKELSAEEQAVAALRRFTTNMQFNEDRSVRLVRLSKPGVCDETLAHLPALAKIDYLAVVCPQVTDAGIAHVAGLTNLDTLMLSGSGVTDAGLVYLAKLTKLERLYLADTKISDEGLKQLAGLTNIHTLSLKNTNVTDEGLGHLQTLAKLETLLLSDTDVTDAGLAHLAGLPKLRVLELAHCKIDGRGLAALEDLPQLEHLSLSATLVNDAALGGLASLSGVKQFELYETKVSPHAILQLRTALPKAGLHVSPEVAAKLRSSAPQGTSPTRKPAIPSDSTTANATAPLMPIRARLDQPDVVPDFQQHVIPLLGRLGCNGRACHGSFQGQGGFRLSMFGYDFQMDHQNLHARLDIAAPDDSLILNKPTNEDEHEGGLRLPPTGWERELLRRWIVAGAAGVATDGPTFVRLDVTPAEIVTTGDSKPVQLRAVALWSDGTREDVTCLTRFESNDDSVAEVTPDGLVRGKGSGDTNVISFYDNGIVATPVMRPISKLTGERYPKVSTPTRIDELVVEKLAKLGITPSELAGDAEFLRRLSLDLIGTLPTPEEIRAFCADDQPDKRRRKIEELLERPAYITWWTTRLCDLTGSNAGYLGGTEMAQPVAAQWRAWIERRVQENVGWDKIVAGIVLAKSRRPGQTYADFITEQSTYTRRSEPADFAALDNSMPHFWFRSNLSQPSDKALAFGFTFLGVRLECAQCHKHPYDQWSKRDFELFSEFFSRIKSGVAADATEAHEQMRNMLGVPKKLDTAALRRQSYLRIAAEGRPIPWKEIYIEPRDKPQPAKLLGGEPIDLANHDDPREPLFKWLLNDPERRFAKAFVNRIWANYFNVGIIDPPDDLNLANPPSNKQLLNYLVRGFVESGYDMKWLHRTIAGSRTYQLTWRTNDTNRTDTRNFSHAVLRRLPAEVAIDAITQATANSTKIAQSKTATKDRKIGQHPKSYQARAIDFSLLIFGKPLRTTNCDCERQNEPTLLQALYLRNDHELLAALQRPDGWLAELAKAKPESLQVDELIHEAYLRTLSRTPTDSELADCRQHIDESENVNEGLHDLLWALLNTQEFIANH